MGGVDFSLWVCESGEAAVVVEGDEEPHDGTELLMWRGKQRARRSRFGM